MRLSIGEMSKLNDVSIQTLRYYDKIGLLKPSEVDSFSNYRYYYEEDCNRLARIKIFKTLGVPLTNIRKMLDGDLADAQALLTEAQDMVKSKMEQLSRILTYLEEQETDIQSFNTMEDYQEPSVKMFHRRQGYVIPVDEDTNYENRIKAINKLNKEYKIDSEILFRPSRIMRIEQDNSRHFKNLLALHRDNYQGKQGDYVLEEGFYGVINHVGRHKNIQESYDCLLAYVADCGYTYKKEAIEIITISSELSVKPEEFVVQVQIPLIK